MSKISASSACALAFCLLGSVAAQQPGTVYELFDDGTTNANDLTGQAFTFTPNAAGGYDITAAGSLLPASNSVIIGDDELLDAIPLGFTINVAGAGAVSTIDISSNGWCAPDGFFTGSDFSESVSQFTDEGARWALLWDDYDPTSGGTFFIDTNPGVSLVVTFDQIPQFNATTPGADANTAQLQIYADGSFVYAYGTVGNDALVGFSAGDGRASAEIDLTTALPIATAGIFAAVEEVGFGCGGTLASLYELFLSGEQDVSGLAFTFRPNASGGYDVTQGGAFIPAFTNNLSLGDDALSTPQALGFTIDIPGAGMVSDIEIHSNGYVAPAGETFSGLSFLEDVDDFLDQGVRFAFWDDYDPTSGGGVFFDTAPGVAFVTYDQVPQFDLSNPGSDANTFQIQFFSNGDVSIVFGAVNPDLDMLFGFSVGGSALGEEIDFSALVSVSTTDALSALPNLAHTSSADPVLGASFDVTVDNQPPATPLALLFVGVLPVFLDLTPIGSSGCGLFVNSVASVPLPPEVGGSSSFTFAVPNITSLAGATIFTQGVVVSPALAIPNAIGTTNGLAHSLGF